ncbi:glycoside hydrolase family 13 protein [Nesterenkonia muleiensis]|uniref:glycoside hydrolase family 13 protein n=1 Tax=Nesterenkonia muleiensis TaxID=2282648 RepID=UPI001EE42C7A|nr:glycoside hydrolase family 13 protein [Nesterenkonia muleiensis]
MIPRPLPHHDGSPLHVSTQAPGLGEAVTLRLRVPESYPRLKQVTVRSNPDHEPHWDTAQHCGTAGGWHWWEAEVTVANPRHGYRWLLIHDDAAASRSAPSVKWLNQSGAHRGEVLDADDFALLAYPGPPDWLNHSVMYQIFPDRFSRSAGAEARKIPQWAQPADWSDPVDPVMPARVCQFYGGDLDGIAERLDHLESLGVGIIYLTPFFPAASNHRYDASSFEAVDPLLGGDEALIRLVDAAHARGMRVIGDLTTNHSGDQHIWFQRALKDPTSPERRFYYFADGHSGSDYESWLGTETLPKFDWTSPELRRAFIEGPDSVVAKWLKPPYNLDGWRIDVANMTGRLREVDLNAEVRQILRRTMEQVKPDSILLAESTNDATGDLTGDSWHGAMTYPSFTRPLWSWLAEPDGAPYPTAEGGQQRVPWFFGQPVGGIPQGTARDFACAVDRFNAPVPWRIRLGNMHPLDTHDTGRFATHAGPQTIAVAIGLQMSLPGLPSVFAGDEFGLTGADGELSRTPIPWDKAQDQEFASRIRLYQELIGLRRRHPVLTDGGMRWLHADDHGLVFVRESEAEALLVFAAGPAQTRHYSVELSATVCAGLNEAQKLWGEAVLTHDGSTVKITASGPSFCLWRLPGVAVPTR